ncbi:hypothetical protein C2G38_2242545 [Gigaspora rosea]|uniref:BTB domain-containing protein n=1 Tax=Gigaspora rosea TaxID=44941 RepID=A0A397VXB2_9GLOM|nr:hypothetical protein C2G38_2242545 [Gigaspora rosea]
MDLRTYNDNNFDVKIIVGNGRDTKEFKAHSTTLRSRSLYFQRALSERWNNKEHGYCVFTKPNIYPSTFEIILNYINTEKVILQTTGQNSLNLLAASDELELLKLTEYIQDHLIKNHSSWLFSNFVVSLNFVCCSDMSLERDDLEFEEKDIWDYLIKWGITNSKKLLDQNISNWFEEDITNWSDDQFSTLKETISQCIPLIRYYHIPKSYIDEQIKKYRLDSSTFIKHKTFKRGSSRLLSNKNKSIISSWIDHKDDDYYNNITDPYKFKLLLRGSRDGFDINTFHKLCDFQGPTIIILKIKTTNELICGYNPTNWAKFTNAIEYYSGYYRLKEIIYSNKTSNSFIFSFTNPSNPILSRIVTRNNNMAIWSDKNHGPCFGTSDLCMESNRWTSIRADYYCRITNLKKFTVEEYEVLALEKFNSSATLNRIQESIFYYLVKILNFI